MTDEAGVWGISRAGPASREGRAGLSRGRKCGSPLTEQLNICYID